MSIDKDLLDRLLEGRSPGDLLARRACFPGRPGRWPSERPAQIDIHPDDERSGEVPEEQDQPPDSRNGRCQKTVTSDSGKVARDFPDGRNGTFDPLPHEQVCRDPTR